MSTDKDLSFRRIKFDANLVHVFDFDGVIVNSQPFHEYSFEKLLKHFGAQTEKPFKLSDFEGLKESEIYDLLNNRYKLQLDISKHRTARLELVKRLFLENEVKPNALIAEFIKKAKGRKILLSSQSKDFVIHCLDTWGLFDRFTEIYAVGDEKIKKMELVDILPTMAGAHPSQIVHYENSIKHLRKTRALGAKSVLVLPRAPSPEEKSEFEWVIQQS